MFNRHVDLEAFARSFFIWTDIIMHLAFIAGIFIAVYSMF